MWCGECVAGCHTSSSSLKLDSIVAVRGKTEGNWFRAKVMKIMAEKSVKLLYVDTGVTDYADVRSICAQTPPMLCGVPQQALECSLDGLKPKGARGWSKAARSRFMELTSADTKATIHDIRNGNCVVVSVFTPYKGVFKSVGEVMRLEGLAEYMPRCPLTLDVPVPRDLISDLGALETVPINCYITNTLQHQREAAVAATSYAYDLEEEPEAVADLEEKEDTNSLLPVATSSVDMVSLSVSSSSTHRDCTISSQLSAHQDGADSTNNDHHDGTLNCAHPDGADSTLNCAHPDATASTLNSAHPECTLNSAHHDGTDSTGSTLNNVHPDGADSTLNNVPPGADSTLNGAHPDGTEPTLKSVPPGNAVSTPDSVRPNENNVCVPKTPPSLEESEEEIDLTSPPLLMTETGQRKRGTLPQLVAMKRAASQPAADASDVDKGPQPASDVDKGPQPASDVDKGPQTVPPPPETKAESNPVEVIPSTSKDDTVSKHKPSQSDSGSELSDNDWLDEDLLPRRSGNSSEVVESPVKELRSDGTPENIPVVTEAAMKMTLHEFFTRNSNTGSTPHPRSQLYSDSYTSRTVRGVFQGMSKEPWHSRGPPKGRGKGKAKRNDAFGGGAKRGGGDAEDKERRQGARGRGRGTRDKFSHRNNAPYKSPDLNFAVAELGSGGSANQPVSVLDPASNEGRQGRSMGLNTVEGDQNRCLDFTVRRPAIALDHSSGDDPRSVGFSMRRPATVPEHSSSGSPPKPAARADYSSSPVAYSQRVKEMSGPEKDHEVQWQEWRIEESATKIIKTLNHESVTDFGGEVEQLISGPTATKITALPKCRNPLQIMMECMVERGVAKTIYPSLFMSALEQIVEGPNGVEVYKMWLNVIGRKASRITESGDAKEEEGNQRCHAFCSFLGSLFCLSPSSSSKCREIIVETVSSCLVIWTKLVSKDTQNPEHQCKLQVESFGALLDAIYSSPNAAALEEVVSLLLKGPVTECVLCDHYPRCVRQAWYSESVKVRKPPLEALPTADGAEYVQESVGEVPVQEGVGLYSGMELRQQGMESNQLLELHQGIESNQVQQSMEPNSSHQGMELNEAQQMNQSQQLNANQSQQLNADQVVMAYSHSYSSQLPPPLSPVNAHPPTLVHNISPQDVPQSSHYQMPEQEVIPRNDSYTRVMVMLETLRLTELFSKFTAAMIKDPVLDCDDLMNVRVCLKDAGIPSGPVLQILYYLECSQKLGPGAGRGVHHQGYHTRHASQMSNPATRSPTLSQHGHYMSASPVTPSPNHSHYLPAAVSPLLPSNACYITRHQQVVSPPYQIPVSHVLPSNSPTVYDTVPEGVCFTGGKPASPLTTYRMQPPPLGNKAGLRQQQPQQQVQPVRQPQAAVQQQQALQQAALQQQVQPFQQQQALQQASLQPMQQAAFQQQVQPIPQQQVPQATALQQQQSAHQQQVQPTPQQQVPQATALQQQVQPAATIQQQMQHSIQLQPAVSMPLLQPAVRTQQQLVPQQASNRKTSVGAVIAGAEPLKKTQSSVPMQQKALAAAPARSSVLKSLDFPPLQGRKPRLSPARAPDILPFQPPSRPQGSGFGRINCVVCGGTDHVTSNCSQRSKFFTHM